MRRQVRGTRIRRRDQAGYCGWNRPILRAALHAKADILLTGDKDFLESGIDTPKIMTAADFAAIGES